MRVAILGGGISGIACARILGQRGYSPVVFEAEPRVGGLCRSEVQAGYVHDLSGGHILHSRDQALLARMVAELGPGGAVECQRNTKIFYRGRWVKYPFENGLADLPVEDNFACLKGYVEAWARRQQGAAEPDSFRDWIAWRMGDGIGRNFMIPYNEKLWCSDLRDVSTSWVSGRVPEAPIEDVLKSSLGIVTEGYTHQLRFHYPRQGGFGTLVERMADPVRSLIRLSTPVSEVTRTEDGYVVNGERFDALINTIALPELYRTFGAAADPAALAAVRGLKFLSIATVFLGVGRANLAPYSWIYLPHPENGPSNRITFLNNYSPENAPAGKSSILAEVTFPGGELPGSLAATEKEVLSSLEANGFFRADEVELVRSHGFRYAYPYYDLGFAARMEVVQGDLRRLGIHSLGRFGAWKYVNTDHVLQMVEEFFRDHFPAL